MVGRCAPPVDHSRPARTSGVLTRTGGAWNRWETDGDMKDAVKNEKPTVASPKREEQSTRGKETCDTPNTGVSAFWRV